MPEPRGKASSASRLLTNMQATLGQRVFWLLELWVGHWRRDRSRNRTLVRESRCCAALVFAVLLSAVLVFAVLTFAALAVHGHELPHHVFDFC